MAPLPFPDDGISTRNEGLRSLARYEPQGEQEVPTPNIEPTPAPPPPSPVYWCGPAPERCDSCRLAVRDRFFDARTVKGPWGILCWPCHENPAIGLGKLGPGFGQQYDRQPDGRFLKTAG